MTKIYVVGSLHWHTWKRNIFLFDVKRERYFLLPLPLPAFEGNDYKDIGLVKYKGKLAMTYIDKKSDFIKV
jgi:hypothetical protein